MFRAAPSIIGFFQSFFRTGDFPRLYGGPSDFHLFGLCRKKDIIYLRPTLSLNVQLIVSL